MNSSNRALNNNQLYAENRSTIRQDSWHSLSSNDGTINEYRVGLWVVQGKKGTRQIFAVPPHFELGILQRFRQKVNRLEGGNGKRLLGRHLGIPW